jgi:predicted AAA+ superfamily ATPase
LFLKKHKMENLLLEFQQKIARTTLDFQRYLIDEIDWNNQLIAIKGARGSGKTTLLLQHIKKHLNLKTTRFVRLDNLYFIENSVIDLAKNFSKIGGTHLLLDEAHKYANWSRELKLIYDDVPELKVVFTSSSMLEIYKSESDLSRRAVSYDLKEMSFREFIVFETGINLKPIDFTAIIENHTEIASSLLQQIKPIPLFLKYLEFGAYPYYKENSKLYHQKLINTINLIIEIDINAVDHISYELIVKLKKLLFAIATSAPFTPNITKLSERIGASRAVLIQAIKQLERAGLVNELYRPTKGIGALTKPEKLFLNNTNLMYALAKENTNVGNLRETFFVNQFKNLAVIHLAEQGDFLINEKYTFEIGGKNKKQVQIQNVDNSFIAKDNIEIGVGNVIPVWLFGFLY